MAGIRDAVAADHHAIHANRETLAQYQALAQKLEAQVGHIVANCKLSREADANLHVLLGDIVSGVERMKGTDRAQSRAGAVQIVGALQTYPKYFDHPAWRGLE
jgi:hypothetical protein